MRSILDTKIDEATGPVVLMVAPEGLDDIRANTDPADWSNDLTRYRGVPVEIHDEWSWGWMIRPSRLSSIKEPDH